jgi:hypothetical protein
MMQNATEIINRAITLVTYYTAGSADTAHMEDMMSDLRSAIAQDSAGWKQLVVELYERLCALEDIIWDRETIQGYLLGIVRGPLTPHQTKMLGEGLDYLTAPSTDLLDRDLDDLITDLAYDRCFSLDQFKAILEEEEDAVIAAVVAVMLVMPDDPAR